MASTPRQLRPQKLSFGWSPAGQQSPERAHGSGQLSQFARDLIRPRACSKPASPQTDGPRCSAVGYGLSGTTISDTPRRRPQFRAAWPDARWSARRPAIAQMMGSTVMVVPVRDSASRQYTAQTDPAGICVGCSGLTRPDRFDRARWSPRQIDFSSERQQDGGCQQLIADIFIDSLEPKDGHEGQESLVYSKGWGRAWRPDP